MATIQPNVRASHRAPSIQAPVQDRSNDDYARTFACARCRVSYVLPRGQKARCPVCKAESEVEQLRQALLEARNRLELQTNELNRLRPQVDLVVAMRQALELIGSEDLMFVKSVAYRHRAGEPVSLQVTTAERGKNKRVPAGFLAAFRSGPETHECSSMGGLALARYVSEGLATVGPITTMQHLMRAMSERLSASTGAI